MSVLRAADRVVADLEERELREQQRDAEMKRGELPGDFNEVRNFHVDPFVVGDAVLLLYEDHWGSRVLTGVQGLSRG